MSTALPISFDLPSGEPTALGLARLGPGDDELLRTMAASAEPLQGVDGLAAYWSSWFASHPRKAPGPFFLERVRSAIPESTYEREAFEEALERARCLERTLLAKHEMRNLKAEAARLKTDEGRRLYAVLLAALADMKRVGSPTKGKAFMVHPDFLEKAQWTVANFEQFLEVHWAMTETHREIGRLLERRKAGYEAHRGFVAGPPDLADSHDESE